MNHLSDQQLIQSIENLVRREREILSDVLQHLKEIDRRKLFSKLGFTSLLDYATKQLKYSPDQAGRRIAAMRLLREIPEAESKVVDGSLTLSSLAQAHWHFRKSEHSQAEKREILVKLENATKRETAAILKHDDEVRYSFGADKSTEEMVEKFRGLNPHLNFDQLMKKAVQIALSQTDPDEKIERAAKRKSRIDRKLTSADQKITSAGKVAVRSRYVPAKIKRHVWSKSRGQCEMCESKFGLEFDHILPFAKGGKTTAENLRLLCRNCNQRSGIEKFGLSKMTQFR